MGEVTDEDKDQLQKIALQTAKTLSDQTNIVIAANSFLFLPFVNLMTSTNGLDGLKILLPVIVCGLGIAINAGLIWYIYTKKPMQIYSAAFKENKGLSNATNIFRSLIDFFQKYAPIVFIIAWCLCLSIVILQLVLGMTI